MCLSGLSSEPFKCFGGGFSGLFSGLFFISFTVLSLLRQDSEEKMGKLGTNREKTQEMASGRIQTFASPVGVQHMGHLLEPVSYTGPCGDPVQSS